MPQTFLDSPLGPIAIRWEGRTLTGVDLDPPCPEVALLQCDAPAGPEAATVLPPPAIIRQFTDYFGCGSTTFDLPLALGGTAFQQRVWSLLRTIPAGRTLTYGEVARALGSAARAVGQACRANPCPIVVPCHRVVAARGLGGFAGDTSGHRLAAKRWLLAHEGVGGLET